MSRIMNSPGLIVLGLSLMFTMGQASPALKPDPPRQCSDCDEWNQPRAPFRLFGNTYYVGVAGLSALLVTSERGHILLDGGLPQSAALIDANIRSLGFRTEDVKVIVNSHGHYDHAGGIAALQRLSGAVVAASASSAQAFERGENTPDDPQYGYGRAANAFPAVNQVRVVADGEVVRVGDLAIEVHMTPGHTPGSTAWTWRSCEGARCLNMVYADSLTPVSAPGFRYTGDATTPSRVEAFRRSIAAVAALPCDIIVSTHPASTGLDRKLARRGQSDSADAFIDPAACRAYAAGAAAQLDARIAEERKNGGKIQR